MRIAMLTNNYKPVVGGVPISIDRLSGALRERGCRVTIFAPHCRGEEAEEGVVRYRSLQPRLPGGVVIPNPLDGRIEREFQKGGFDLIHMHHPMMIGYTGLYLAREYGLPLAMTYHTRYEQYLHHVKPYAALQRRRGTAPLCRLAGEALLRHNRGVADRCDLVFAPTPTIRGELLEQGVSAPVAVLPTGLGREDFDWEEGAAARIRARYVPGGERLFCSVSRLEKEKNIPFLLQALARYRALYGGGFRLLLIGEGGEREALERRAGDLGLGDNVVFAGGVAHRELSSYYRACDLFLFASKSETQGLVLLEAMAAQLPVVAVQASGVRDVVEDGCNGWQTPEDADVFASRMRITCAGPVRERMGRAAWETARSCTAERMADDALAHYRALVREKQRVLLDGASGTGRRGMGWL